jgi:hypothetical protein
MAVPVLQRVDVKADIHVHKKWGLRVVRRNKDDCQPRLFGADANMTSDTPQTTHLSQYHALCTAVENIRSNIFYWMMRNHHRDEKSYAMLGQVKERLTESLKNANETLEPPDEDQLEASCERGAKSAWMQMVSQCIQNLGWTTDVGHLVRMQMERQKAINVLRDVCKDHGDNDWPDDMNLPDIISKHLGRYLDDK